MREVIKRRSLLLGTTALALGAWVGGCRRSPHRGFRVDLLRNSVPAQLLREFQQQVHPLVPLMFQPQRQLADLLRLLETWNTVAPDTQAAAQEPVADLITLGDYWLSAAVQQDWLQPLQAEAIASLPEWQSIPPRWQQLGRRDRQGAISSTGNLWGVPYRWGSLVLVYNRAAFQSLGWTPSDWGDLWHPAVQGRVSLLDSPRAVIGLTLKKLGYSLNHPDLNAVSGLAEDLAALQRQVKVYSSDTYLQPLLLGDTHLGIGWSTDVLPLLQRDRRIAASIPTSGTALFADLWVKPKTAPAWDANTSSEAADLSQAWIQFCWQADIAPRISSLTDAASPTLLTQARSSLAPELQENTILLPDPIRLERSQFFDPLSEGAIAQYQAYWTRMRQG